MNKSKQIQEEYSNLKSKVEGRIRELESKLVPLPSPSKSRTPLLQTPPPHHHCHPFHHSCHHNHCLSPQQSLPAQLSLSYIDPLTSEAQSQRQINMKNHHTNDLLSEVMVESLRNQRQINENIKAINEKIENLSVEHNRSHLSEAFSESVRKPKAPPQPRREVLLSQQRGRCHSEAKGQQQQDHNKTETKRYNLESQRFNEPISYDQGQKRHEGGSKRSGAKGKKIKSKLRSHASSKLLEGSVRMGQSKSKSKTKIESEYFLSFGCPVHSPNKISLKSIQRKEVYKDSERRNKKHEKNHLLESFRQQERSRKRLISKISHNAFSEYGKK